MAHSEAARRMVKSPLLRILRQELIDTKTIVLGIQSRNMFESKKGKSYSRARLHVCNKIGFGGTQIGLQNYKKPGMP